MTEVRICQVDNGYIIEKKAPAMTRTMVFNTLDEVMQELLTEFEGRYAGLSGDSYGLVTIERG